MWEILIESAIFPEESEECYTWLLNSRDAPAGQYDAIDNSALQKLFNKRMLSREFLDYIDSPIAFKCFQFFFCEVNKLKSLMATSKDNNVLLKRSVLTKFKQEKYEVLFSPDLLHGFRQLWEIILSVKDENIVEQSLQFLESLQSNLAINVRQTLSPFQLHKDFIATCMVLV